MIQEAWSLEEAEDVLSMEQIEDVFCEGLEMAIHKEEIEQRRQKAWWLVKQKQTMWATHDKDVLFCATTMKLRVKMLNWQIKDWWSSLLMEMLLKVALQCVACALQSLFDENFDANFSRDSLQDENFFCFWTLQGLEAIYGYLFWYRLCEAFVF